MALSPTMTRGRATVRAVKLRVRNDVLHVDVIRGVGFRAVERDQWAGPYRRTYAEARADAAERNTAK